MPKLQADQVLRFDPYRLDPRGGHLWRGTLEVKLTPKALAVLRHLVRQPGQVVSKEAFFRAVWADTVVSDAALTSCIQELRQALHDEARNPRYIAPLMAAAPPVSRSRFQVSNSRPKPTPNPQFPTPSCVGREGELRQLH